MPYPTVSIVIPTLNGEDTLAELLAMLSVQTIPIQEILIIDSSSDDSTPEIANQYGANYIKIDRQNFDHGRTRSEAALQTSGELIVFFTQDAIPVGKRALEHLIRQFSVDDNIGAAYGRQLPSFSANPFATHLRYFNYPQQSDIRSLNDSKRLGLATVFLSNSFSAYRRAVLQEIDFFPKDLVFGEDACAAGRILMTGWKIAYVAEAAVYHSHNYTCIEEFKRYFDIGVLHQTQKWLLNTFGNAQSRGNAFVKSEVSFLIKEKKWFLLPLSFLRNFLKLVAYKSGRNFSRLPATLIHQLSMNSRWWQDQSRSDAEEINEK